MYPSNKDSIIIYMSVLNTLSLKIVPHVIVVVRSWGSSLGASPINLYLHYMYVQNKLYLVYSENKNTFFFFF